MKKAESLKALLLRVVTPLAANPENLTLFVDRGRIGARAGSGSFEYRYKLNLVVQDYAGSLDVLIVPILAWIADNQPELLQKRDSEPFAFESELLDGDLSDVSIEIDLTERVLVTPGQGGVHVDHLSDRLPHDAFADVGDARLVEGVPDPVA